ncbi:MAG: response regulator [Magnetococcales bacterium]|nr:response regulator [Magnetococcales bacterium]
MDKKAVILIVDDERFNLNLLTDLLKADYRIMAARSGQLALKAARSDPPPDLILLDVMMPEMDGYEVCRQLKAAALTRDIPVIFVTAMVATEDETQGLELGAVDYITKPISPPIALARIRNHLELKRQRDLQGELLQQSLQQAAELSRINAALNESEALFRKMSDLAQDAVVRIDNAGHICFWNQAASRIFGYGVDEIMGRRLHDVLVPESVRDNAWRCFLEFQETGKGAAINRTVELLALRKDGQEIPVELSIAAIEHQSQWHAVGIVRDVTDRKRTEERERYAQFQAGVAEMGVSVLHNIGNAIMSIINRAEDLTRGSRELEEIATLLSRIGALIHKKIDEGKTPQEMLDELVLVIEEVGDTLTTLANTTFAANAEKIRKGVDHIAEIVKIQQNAAQTMPHRTRFGVRNLIEDAVTIQQETMDKYGIQVDIQVEKGLTEVQMPRSQMLQMMINLIKNSREAITARTEDSASFVGRIHISARELADEILEIRVQDNGCGIAPEHMPEIFRFGFTTKQRGTGLGLHSVSNFVQSLDGVIQARSRGPGQGAEIVVRLPLAVGG